MEIFLKRSIGNIFRKKRDIYLNITFLFIFYIWAIINLNFKGIYLYVRKKVVNMHAMQYLKSNVVLKIIHNRFASSLIDSSIPFSVINDISNKRIDSDAKF